MLTPNALTPRWTDNLCLHHPEQLRFHRTPSPPHRNPQISHVTPHLPRRRLLHAQSAREENVHHGSSLRHALYRPLDHVDVTQHTRE